MTWATKRAAVKAAFETIMPDGLHNAVAWEDEQRPWGDPILLLKIIATNQENSKTRAVVNGVSLDLTHYAMRQFTVQVKVESTLQGGLDVADTLKLRTRRLSFLEPLHAIGVDLVDPDAANETLEAGYDLDGQRIEARIFDLPMRGIFTDTDPDALGTIGTVNIDGTLDPDAIAIPIQATE